MNAQERWKELYRKLIRQNSKRYMRVTRTNMHHYRREAALERMLAAQQRRIVELNEQLDDALAEINSRDEREALRDKLEWG